MSGVSCSINIDLIPPSGFLLFTSTTFCLPGGADITVPGQDQGHQRAVRHLQSEADRVRVHARH